MTIGGGGDEAVPHRPLLDQMSGDAVQMRGHLGRGQAGKPALDIGKTQNVQPAGVHDVLAAVGEGEEPHVERQRRRGQAGPWIDHLLRRLPVDRERPRYPDDGAHRLDHEPQPHRGWQRPGQEVRDEHPTGALSHRSSGARPVPGLLEGVGRELGGVAHFGRSDDQLRTRAHVGELRVQVADGEAETAVHPLDGLDCAQSAPQRTEQPGPVELGGLVVQQLDGVQTRRVAHSCLVNRTKVSVSPRTIRLVAAEVVLTADEARRIALRAQALLGVRSRRGDVSGLLRELGAVQLDTISVLARSHELVPYARLGAIGRPAVELAYWGHRPARAFEYWSHAACVLPTEEWPYFAFRRRAIRDRGRRWHRLSEQTCAEVLIRLKAEGPMTATDLGGAKAGGEWWDWSDVKIAVEWLLDIGEVICVERRGWRRVYDLPERVLPPGLLGQDPDDEECLTRLVGFAGQALGVAAIGDLADYHRLKQVDVKRVVGGSGLVPVQVAGWLNGMAWADPGALAAPVRGRHRTTLLSPFDSLIWDRRRTSRIFGFDHRLEAYTPAPKRVHGYFTMPLLTGGRLVGRVDPKRSGRTLVARQLSMDSSAAIEPMAGALIETATWVGCDNVVVERVTPELHAAPLRALLS
jgi:uncharacterized protein